MVLFGIVGELGAGKTITLTYLGWKNWYFRKKVIYANYHLYGIPYIYIDTVEKLDHMRDGYFLADEFWLWIDSRASKKGSNKIVSDILLKSRKRGLTYCFTSQLLDLLDKRVRKVMDFTAYPIMGPDESVVKAAIFRTGFPRPGNYLKTFYFKTPVIFNLYNHREEIAPLREDEQLEATAVSMFDMSFKELEEGDQVKVRVEVAKLPPIIVWQPTPDTPPMFFNSWEEADKVADEFWTHIPIKKVI